MKVNIGPWRKNRKMEVKIHEYDTWSMNHTMSLVLLPLFQKFRNTRNRTIPCIAFKDPSDHSEQSWINAEKEWLETVDKIIWSLNEIVNEENTPEIPSSFKDCSSDPSCECKGLGMKYYNKDDEALFDKQTKEYEARLQEGFDLLGKYFQHFWC